MDKETWKSIKKYYSELLEMEESSQEEFLQKLERSEPETAKVLRSLLNEESDPFPGIDSPAASKFQDSNTQDHSNLVGQQIGKYKLTFLIGIGGMGQVYLADRTDLEAHQQVAVKVINTGYLGEIYSKRFDRERKILSRLNHPHITRIYDGGISEAGRPFIVMEYVEGKPLLEYVKDQNLSLDKRLELFLDLCSALNYAHQNFIMHRDLKPGNILVSKHGIVKVIDFGIAKILEDDVSDEELTIMGYIPLTPAYASPEQLKGEPLTMVSDIYSLGVILYELLTGTKPFPGNTKSNIALTERINHLGAPAKPSTQIDPEITADLKSWKKSIEGDIDNIILKALKEAPAERYSNAEQFAEDIKRHQKNYPVLARPDSIGYRFKKYVRRNRSLVSLGAALILILISGIAATLWQARIAAEQRDQARYEAAKANQVTQFLTNLFDFSDPDKAKGKVINSENMLAMGSERLKELSGQPELQAEMYRVVGDLYRKQNFFPQAEEHLLTALQLFEEEDGPESLEVGKTKLLLAELYAFMNNTEQTLGMSKEAAEIFARELGKESMEYVKAISYRGRGENQQGDYLAAIETLTEASQLMQNWQNPDEDQSIAMASVYNDLATAYSGTGDNQMYISYIHKALDQLVKGKGELNQNVAALYNNLGHGYYFSEKYDSAEYFTLKALKIADEVYGGKSNDRSQFSHCDLAKIYVQLDRLDEALEHAEYCHSMASDVYGENHTLTARGLGVIGDVYLARDDFSNADKFRNEATKMYEAFYDGPNPMLAWHYWDEATRYEEMENLPKAIEYKRKCLDMYDQTMPEAHADIAEAKEILAGFLVAADSVEQALPVLKESLALYRKAYGKENEATQAVLSDLTGLYEQLNRNDEAERLRSQFGEVEKI